MKRLFSTLFAIGVALLSWAAPYGILVNGQTFIEGEAAGEFEGFTQYLAHVQVSAGDYCQLYDKGYNAAWAVDVNSYSVAGFKRNGNKIDVSVSGCYDFYIKLKYEADELYIGNGSGCYDPATTEYYIAGEGLRARDCRA